MRFDQNRARFTKYRKAPTAHSSYGRSQVYDSTSNTWMWLALLQQNSVHCPSSLPEVTYAESKPVDAFSSGYGGDYGGGGASSSYSSSSDSGSSSSYSSSD